MSIIVTTRHDGTRSITRDLSREQAALAVADLLAGGGCTHVAVFPDDAAMRRQVLRQVRP